jgi:hypothetical protein
MQWAEFGLRVPPAMSEFAEFFQFGRVGIDALFDWFHGVMQVNKKSPARQGFFEQQ